MSTHKLSFLGPPQLERDGASIEVSRRKSQALLAYLAVTGHARSRVALSTLFWPDYDAGAGRAYLRCELAVLNKALGEGFVAATREQVGLAHEAELWCDVAHFRHLLTTGRGHDHPSEELCADCITLLNEAIDLYRGDFITGFTLPDAHEFDDWQFFTGEELRQAFAHTLKRMITWQSQQGDYAVALPLARRYLALDPPP